MITVDTRPLGSEEQAVDQRVNILLVDDQPANLQALEAILKTLTANVVKARSGLEALRCLLNEDFALILLDVKMPGMDGFEMVKALRGDPRTCDVRVMMLTSEASVESEANGLAAGADDYILKPVEPRRLAARVKALLGRSRPRAA